jgi:hypothetical protein
MCFDVYDFSLYIAAKLGCRFGMYGCMFVFWVRSLMVDIKNLAYKSNTIE